MYAATFAAGVRFDLLLFRMPRAGPGRISNWLTYKIHRDLPRKTVYILSRSCTQDMCKPNYDAIKTLKVG